jgi:hypothetical protein
VTKNVSSELSVVNNITIDPEFQALIPPPAPQELALLEANILAEGRARDPLALWGDVLLDGHNRLSICQRHNLPFTTFQVPVKGRAEAIAWIVTNQLGRRNLTAEQTSYLRGRRYNAEKTAGHGAKSGAQIERQNGGRKTDERLAEEFKTSPATIRRDGKFAEALDVLEGLAEGLRAAVLRRGVDLSRQDVLDLARLAAKDPEKARKVAGMVQAGEAVNVRSLLTLTCPTCGRTGFDVPVWHCGCGNHVPEGQDCPECLDLALEEREHVLARERQLGRDLQGYDCGLDVLDVYRQYGREGVRVFLDGGLVPAGQGERFYASALAAIME